MLQFTKLKFTAIHGILKELELKLNSKKLQAVESKASIDAAQSATSSECLTQTVSSGSLVDECHRCTIEIASFLFDLSVINGCKNRLATNADKTEIHSLLTTLNERICKIATDYEKESFKIILKDVTDTLERYHRDCITAINSILGKRTS